LGSTLTSFVNFDQVTSIASLSESGQLKNLQSLRVRKEAYPFNHPSKTSLDALNPQNLRPISMLCCRIPKLNAILKMWPDKSFINP
jgi:hypothetical protein